MDGIQYACVSKNLEEGYGSFWFPFLSPFWCQNGAFHFFEHPPLFYWVESCYFRFAGDFAEQLFCGSMWLLNAWLIQRLWSLLYFEHHDARKHGWLPVLLWTVTPVCFWCFQNNMIEILVSVFVLAFANCCLHFLLHGRNRYALLMLSGGLLYGAFLTKGLIALFPLALFVCYALTRAGLSLRHAFWYTFVVFASFAVLFMAVYWVHPSARYTLDFYFRERLVHRLAETPTTNNRFELLFDLVSQLLPVLGLVLIVYLTQRARRQLPVGVETGNWFGFFLLLGLCGSLPIMLTLVQKGFYFMPALAFFALAFASLIIRFFPSLDPPVATRSYRIFTVSMLMVLVLSICIVLRDAGGYNRDEALLREVDELAAAVTDGQTINADMPVYTKWNYQFYLQRYHHVYLDPTHTYRRYAITSDASLPWLKYYRMTRRYPETGFVLYERR